jgi:tetratricopeptide (TPR) repeat protein
MPRPIKKRIHRAESAEESLHNVVERIKKTADERGRQLMVGAIAIVALLAIAVGTFYYRASAERKAAALEYQGYKVLNGLYVDLPEPMTLRAGRALPYFEQAYKTRPSSYSLYYIGLCRYEMSEYGAAIETFERLIKLYPDDTRMLPPALYKLGMTHLRAGRPDQALEVLGSFNVKGIKAFGDLALIESARILESLGRSKEATMMYETLIYSFPTSIFAAEARSLRAMEEAAPAAQAEDRPLVLRPPGDESAAPEGLPQIPVPAPGQ